MVYGSRNRRKKRKLNNSDVLNLFHVIWINESHKFPVVVKLLNQWEIHFLSSVCLECFPVLVLLCTCPCYNKHIFHVLCTFSVVSGFHFIVTRYNKCTLMLLEIWKNKTRERFVADLKGHFGHLKTVVVGFLLKVDFVFFNTGYCVASTDESRTFLLSGISLDA